jgi:VWFA-related protein
MLREPKQNSSSAQGPTNPIQDLDKTTFDTMDTLAEGTGGKAFYNTNDLSSSLRSAIDDSRVTYELGYYPSDVKWDGSFHTVTVELKKPDLVVRARKGYFALPEPALSPDACATSSPTQRSALSSPQDWAWQFV